MKILIPFLLAVHSLVANANESAEPGLNYTLKIGDRSYAIKEGESFELEPVPGKTEARLVADTYRIFSYQNLRLKYPRYFSFEADLSGADDKSWTLSGNDCKIMILAFAGTLTPKQFAENLAQTFGEENTKITDVKVKLGATVYEAALLDTTVAGSRMKMEILPAASPEGWTKLLVFQDSVSNDGAHSEEYKELMKVLRESFAESASTGQDAASKP